MTLDLQTRPLAALHLPVTSRVAQALAEIACARAGVTLRHPDGRLAGDTRPGRPTLQINDTRAVFRRLAHHPKIGLGEAYTAGEWDEAEGHDLADVFAPFARTLATALPRPFLALRRLVDRAIPEEHRNTRNGARANIEAHYDLSNDLFAAFLDPSLSYSSALFDTGRPFAEQDLEAAQHRKIDRILDAAGVGDGCRLLEIGSGWGELAIRAASRGADITSITLSPQQQRLATERIAQAGLQHRARVELLDYRDVTGEFDAVVSVEMIEAVGEDYWIDYFTAIDRVLTTGGTVVIQSILMDHQRLQATRRSYGWIQKHIFPGGLIPSTTALQEAAREGSSLDLVDVHPFGKHYGETLLRWRTRFDERWPHISTLGFDEAFRRTWRFYLAYCQAGFDTGYLDVAHLTFRRPACA